MKAIFEFPNDYMWHDFPRRDEHSPRGWTATEAKTWTRKLKNGTILRVDPPNRHIIIETPSAETPAPWVAIYTYTRQLMGMTLSSTRIPTAKRWFRKLRVIAHEGARSDRHPVDANPQDNSRNIRVEANSIIYDKSYGYYSKKEFLSVMGTLYDQITTQLKRQRQ